MYSLGLLILLAVGVSTAPRHGSYEDETLDCHGRPSELYFLLDSSTSIWPVNFTKQLHFVSDVIGIFKVSSTHTRIGVGSFSRYFRENFPLTRYDNKEDVQNAVLNIRQMFGGTFTYDALDRVRTQGLGSHVARPGVVRIAIVITDGESYDARKTEIAAAKLKDEGVTVFAVGIGKKTDEKELKAIASEPSEKFVFNVSNFDLLKTIQEKLAMSACAVQLQDEPIPGPACGAENKADVIFIADSSHLSSTHVVDVFDFIADVTNDFNMETGNIQVGIESRHCGSGNMQLGHYKNKNELLDAVKVTKHSALQHLIKRVRNQAYKEINGGRVDARRMAVIFVDDKLDDTAAIIKEAELAKDNDIDLFVVAIGDKINEEELKQMCSTDRHYMKADSYAALREIKEEFMDKFCHGL